MSGDFVTSSTVPDGLGVRLKRAVGRLARRVLPGKNVTLAHVDPKLTLTVNLRRHVMFWSGGLAKFEPHTVTALRAAVVPGDTVLDVGANIGFFTTLLSTLVGPDGLVIAFEPEAENLKLLRTNVARNDCRNVEVVPAAVGAAAGLAPFSVDASTGSTGRLGEGLTAGELAVGSGPGQPVIVETRVETIDAVVAERKVVPAVIKMDIEGGELDALTGAETTLAEHRPIVITELGGDRGSEVIAKLDALGYRMRDLESGRGVAPGDSAFMVVAIPAERAHGERSVAILKALGASLFERE